MKATYDARTDTFSIILKPDVDVTESDEDKPGIVLDYDRDGNLVSLKAITETMELLQTHPDAEEILVDRVRILRDAEREGRYDQMIGLLNSIS